MEKNKLTVQKTDREGTCTHCGSPNFPWEGKNQVPELFHIAIGTTQSRQGITLCRQCLTDMMMRSIAALRDAESNAPK